MWTDRNTFVDAGSWTSFYWFIGRMSANYSCIDLLRLLHIMSSEQQKKVLE